MRTVAPTSCGGVSLSSLVAPTRTSLQSEAHGTVAAAGDTRREGGATEIIKVGDDQITIRDDTTGQVVSDDVRQVKVN